MLYQNERWGKIRNKYTINVATAATIIAISIIVAALHVLLCIPSQAAIIIKTVMGLYASELLMSNFSNDRSDLVIPQVGHGIPKKHLIGQPTRIS